MRRCDDAAGHSLHRARPRRAAASLPRVQATAGAVPRPVAAQRRHHRRQARVGHLRGAGPAARRAVAAELRRHASPAAGGGRRLPHRQPGRHLCRAGAGAGAGGLVQPGAGGFRAAIEVDDLADDGGLLRCRRHVGVADVVRIRAHRRRARIAVLRFSATRPARPHQGQRRLHQRHLHRPGRMQLSARPGHPAADVGLHDRALPRRAAHAAGRDDLPVHHECRLSDHPRHRARAPARGGVDR